MRTSTTGRPPCASTILLPFLIGFLLSLTLPCKSVSNDPLLIRAARGEPVERTPVWMMRQAGRHMHAYRALCKRFPTFRERSETPSVAAEVSLQPYRAYGVDGVILFSDILTPLPAMGLEFQVTEAGGVEIEPILTRECFEKRMKHQSFHPETDVPFVAETLKLLSEQLRGTGVALLGFIGMPFTLATYILEGRTGTKDGFARTREMMESDPKLLREILDLLTDRLAEYAEYQIKSGAQIIQLFDSWSGWLEPQLYDEWVAPYQKRVVSKLKRKLPHVPLILYAAPMEHSSGGAYLKRMAQTGVDVIGIDHTVSLDRARQLLDEEGFGHVTLQGNMNPSTLRDGPEGHIVEQTRCLMESAIQDSIDLGPSCRRYIMNLGHGIDKDTPESHAALFVNTVRAFRMRDNSP